jgi:hypothetical protein
MIKSNDTTGDWSRDPEGAVALCLTLRAQVEHSDMKGHDKKFLWVQRGLTDFSKIWDEAEK